MKFLSNQLWHNNVYNTKFEICGDVLVVDFAVWWKGDDALKKTAICPIFVDFEILRSVIVFIGRLAEKWTVPWNFTVYYELILALLKVQVEVLMRNTWECDINQIFRGSFVKIHGGDDEGF